MSDVRERPRIAVVGAGLAGLTAADRLARAGASVTVIEKSRGPGGRAATRHADPWRFDHGMQYFTARSEPFRRQVAAWTDAGVVAPWRPRPAPGPSEDPGGSLPDASRRAGATNRDAGGGAGGEAGGGAGPGSAGARGRAPAPPSDWHVGVPGSNAPCRALAAGRRLLTRTRIERVEPGADGPRLVVAESSAAPGRPPVPPDPAVREELETGPWDAVLVTAPAPQAAAMLEDPGLAAVAADSDLAPCWALMVGLPSTAGADWDVRRGRDEPLAWIARESSKPGRTGPGDGPGETWIVHASPAWSLEHLERPAEDAAGRLWAMAAELLEPAAEPVVLAAHRWRHALVTDAAEGPSRWDAAAGIGLAGDWMIAGRLESAFASGLSLAEQVAETHGLELPGPAGG